MGRPVADNTEWVTGAGGPAAALALVLTAGLAIGLDIFALAEARGDLVGYFSTLVSTF